MAPPLKEDRDTELCRRYMAGETPNELCKEFDISRERVRQILRKHGVYQKGRRFRVKSSRRNYLGVTISENDKAALKAEADKRGVSMSSLTADMIREMLGKTG